MSVLDTTSCCTAEIAIDMLCRKGLGECYELLLQKGGPGVRASHRLSHRCSCKVMNYPI